MSRVLFPGLEDFKKIEKEGKKWSFLRRAKNGLKRVALLSDAKPLIKMHASFPENSVPDFGKMCSFPSVENQSSMNGGRVAFQGANKGTSCVDCR